MPSVIVVKYQDSFVEISFAESVSSYADFHFVMGQQSITKVDKGYYVTVNNWHYQFVAYDSKFYQVRNDSGERISEQEIPNTIDYYYLDMELREAIAWLEWGKYGIE